MITEPATVRFTAQPAEALRASQFINERLRLLMRLPPVILFLTGLAIVPFLGWPEVIPDVLILWSISLLFLGFALVLPILSRRYVARRYPHLFETETASPSMTPASTSRGARPRSFVVGQG